MSEIEITCPDLDARQLEALLRAQQEFTQTVLEVRSSKGAFRGVDPPVLVAMVGVAGTALGALITGLLKFAAGRESQCIEVRGSDWSVRAPASMSREQLDELIEKAQASPIQRIIVE